MRTSSIYVWLDPATGAPVYVGKTSMPLARRMMTHRRLARVRARTPKEKWLADHEPVVRIIETCSIAVSAARERRWHRRISRRFTLLNCKSVGAGNPGVGRVVWTPELDAQLGSVADAVIAERLGCHRKTVSYRREQLGIAASMSRVRNTPPPSMGGWNRATLTAETISQLGSMPDYALAEAAGVTKKAIARERKRRGIASYAATTGNDGRIRTGELHRRWHRERPNLRTGA